jgi:hypothetical protein
MDNSDIIYLDTTIYNDSAQIQPATISITRQNPILTNPKNYKMSVIRFDINCRNVPCILFNDQFRVSYIYNNVQYDAFLIAPIDIDQNNIGWYDRPDDFIRAINLAFENVHNQLNTNVPSLNLLVAPSVYINDNNNVSIVFEQKYIDAETIKIFFSRQLNDKIDGFPMIINSLAQIRIIGIEINYIENSLKNSNNIGLPIKYSNINTNLYRLNNYSFNISMLNDVRSIYISSNIPVDFENVINLDTNNQQNVQKITQNRITDFLFYASSNPYDARNRVTYIPSIYRYINMSSEEPLKSFDIQVFFETYDKKSYRLKILPDTSLSLKIMFEKK